MKYANLHLHTNYSDGVLTPLEICQTAKEMGYGAVALADHHTPNGYKELVKAAEMTGMECILGMEDAGVYEGYYCHIVGYDFDPTENKMAEHLKNESDFAYLLTKAKFESLVRDGHISGITWQNVLDDSPADCWFCNEHIFNSLVKRTGITQADYWEYIGHYGKAQAEVSMPHSRHTAEEIIGLIRNSGGIASLAHPHHITKFLPGLCKLGLNCVEYDHPDIDEQDIAEVLKFANANKGIYLAGGTDHTGKLSNYPELRGDPEVMGCFLVSLATDVRSGATKEEFDAIKNRIYG